MNKLKTKLFALAIITFSIIATFGVAYAASEGTSAGTASVSSAVPTITSPELWNMTENGNKNNTALTVNTEYHINFTIADSNTLADLNNVTIRIWLSGTATENGSDTQTNHYSYTWVESTDTWASLTGASYIVAANTTDPGTAYAGTSYEFRLAFKLSRTAAYATTPNWKISIFVWDDSSNADDEKTLMGGIAFYSEISITDTTHAWAALTPGGSNNVTVGGDGDIDFTVIANAAWDGETKANAALTKGGDTIALTNLRFHKTTLASSAAITTTYQDIGALTNQTATTDEASPTATYETLWLTVPSGTPSGDYTYTLYIQITQT